MSVIHVEDNNTIKGVLRGTFTALNTYICKHEKMTLSEKKEAVFTASLLKLNGNKI